MRHHFSNYFPVILFSSLLAACGGGSGGGDGDSPNISLPDAQAASGVFLDSPVQGLTYQTPTYSGVTDGDGRFQYSEGEDVTFTLFGNTLGPIPAAQAVTPFDFIENAQFADIALNLVRLLISIDVDGDLSTINLPSSGTAAINFDQLGESFEQDQSVLNFVASNSNTTLASESIAQQHISETLEEYGANVEVDLRNTVVHAELIDDRCPNPDERAIITYEFADTDVTISGNYRYDEFCNAIDYGSDFVEPTPNDIQPLPNPIAIADFMSGDLANIFYCGDAICSLQELNRVNEDLATAHSAGSKHFRATITNRGSIQRYYVALEGYTVNFAGRTGSSVITTSNCPESTKGGYDYVFGTSEFSRVGSDGFESRNNNTCVVEGGSTSVRSYSENDPSGDSIFPCVNFPVCTYSELNRYDEGVDDDNRSFRKDRTHLAGTKQFSSISQKGVIYYTTLTLD